MKSVRLEATKYIWTGFAVIMALMFAGPFFNNMELGAGHIVLGVVVSIATFLSTGTVWNWGSIKLDNEFIESENSEKSKRSHSLDSLIDQMSDDELLDLREELRRSKNSDGELLYRENRR